MTDKQLKNITLQQMEALILLVEERKPVISGQHVINTRRSYYSTTLIASDDTPQTT